MVAKVAPSPLPLLADLVDPLRIRNASQFAAALCSRDGLAAILGGMWKLIGLVMAAWPLILWIRNQRREREQREETAA